MTVLEATDMAGSSNPATKDDADLGALATFVQKNGFKPRGENNEVMTVVDDATWATVKALDALGISKSMTIRAGVAAMMESWRAGKIEKLSALIR